jgi:hypothetical protein
VGYGVGKGLGSMGQGVVQPSLDRTTRMNLTTLDNLGQPWTTLDKLKSTFDKLKSTLDNLGQPWTTLDKLNYPRY